MSELDEVRSIVLRGLRGTPARVYLFGSRARGEAARMSDINVAVLPLQPLPPGLLSLIREELAEELYSRLAGHRKLMEQWLHAIESRLHPAAE